MAKNVFQLHGADERGKCILHKRLSREKLKEFVAKLPPCLIGIEACIGAHYWARVFESMGHIIRMMAPHLVKPYTKSNKNDKNGAGGIAEALTRPEMEFIPIKKIEQQDILLLHRARELVIKQRTVQANQIKGLLAEYGIIIPQGIYNVEMLLEFLDEKQNKLTERSKAIFKQLYEQFRVYNNQIDIYDKQLKQIADEDEICKKIMKI